MTTLRRPTAAQRVELAQLIGYVLRSERQIAALCDQRALAFAAEDEAQKFPNDRVDRLPGRDIHHRRDDPGQRILLGDQRLHGREHIGSRWPRRKLEQLDRWIG